MDARDLESRLVSKVEQVGAHRIFIRARYVFCAKKCATCESGTGHGPYHYAQWREGKKWGSLYIGKTVPQEFRKLLHKKKTKS